MAITIPEAVGQMLAIVDELCAAYRPWRLSESARTIREDEQIDRAWRRADIDDLQIGGVWVFARWTTADQHLLGAEFVAALSRCSKARKATGES
jgi:hypothetical protein